MIENYKYKVGDYVRWVGSAEGRPRDGWYLRVCRITCRTRTSPWENEDYSAWSYKTYEVQFANPPDPDCRCLLIREWALELATEEDYVIEALASLDRGCVV
jgi:hypothetical protein